MLCLSGFELYSRWVLLIIEFQYVDVNNQRNTGKIEVLSMSFKWGKQQESCSLFIVNARSPW